MAYSGKYQPSFPKKYKGDPTNIIYRSLWERKFMRYCDLNENIALIVDDMQVLRVVALLYQIEDQDGSVLNVWNLLVNDND